MRAFQRDAGQNESPFIKAGTMLIGIFITCAVCVALFLLTIPLDCWRAIRMNVRRLDGSFSTARLRREFRALLDYAMSLALPFVLIIPSVFVGTLFVCNFIMPPDLLARGFEDFSFDPQEWKTELHDEKADHAEFLREQGLTAEMTKQLQDMVWYGSPVIGLSALIFAAFGFVWILKRTGESAAQLGVGIRRRRKEYAHRDVERMSTANSEESTSEGGSGQKLTAHS